MVRIVDIAEAAGVSKATVSRALTRPEMVSDRTRARILAIAAQRGFQPNRAARALTTGRTGLIGMIVPSLANPFFAPLVLGAQEAAAQTDRHVLVATSEHSADREHDLVDRLADQVDGFIMVAPVGGDRALRRLAREHPLILVDQRVGRLPAVVLDTAAGVGELAAHLIRLGHRHLAYVGGPPHSWSDTRRREVLHAHTAAAGVSLTVIGPLLPAFDAGLAAAAQLPADATAVIAYNSSLTLGLLHALVTAGTSVPGQVSLASGDDIAAFGLTTPGITAVAVPGGQAGRDAVTGLLRLLDGLRPTEQVIVPSRLILRASTDVPPTGLR